MSGVLTFSDAQQLHNIGVIQLRHCFNLSFQVIYDCLTIGELHAGNFYCDLCMCVCL